MTFITEASIAGMLYWTALVQPGAPKKNNRLYIVENKSFLQTSTWTERSMGYSCFFIVLLHKICYICKII